MTDIYCEQLNELSARLDVLSQDAVQFGMCLCFSYCFCNTDGQSFQYSCTSLHTAVVRYEWVLTSTLVTDMQAQALTMALRTPSVLD